MFIKEVNISNFRGLTINITDLKTRFLIIGKNDSGKTNFCHAIRKVLDNSFRRQPMADSDSTDSNKNDISIKITLDLRNISSNNRALLGEHIDINENGEEFLTVELKASFNEDTQVYDENIIFGTIDPSNPKSASNGNELDKILDFIYVYPNYDLSRDTKNYFSYHKSENSKNKISVGQEIYDGIKGLNDTIALDDTIKKMRDELNDIELMKDMFGEVSFEIQSDFDMSNIYKSLKINSMLADGKLVNIGDGKSKTLALLLQKLTKNNTKEKIIVLEEPENHLFPLLQKQYASIIDRFDFGQTIITTHSPSIIDFRKTEEILKFSYIQSGNRVFNVHRINVDETNIYKDFGYSLNEEIAESFFYDEVLLIEGYSEKLFYNILVNTDEIFRTKTLHRGLGFVCVYGADFIPAKSILESLGVKVHILTDNDFFSVKGEGNIKRFAGLQNALKMLNQEEREQLNSIFGYEINNEMFKVVLDSDEHNHIIEIMPILLDAFKVFNIYIHNNEDGFEGAFVDFIDLDENEKADVIQELKRKKLRNLHQYLLDNNISVIVNNQNKDNILVKFVYEN